MSKQAAEAPGVGTGSRRRRARGSLSREEILDAAQEIVERDGLRQLRMPALAVHLQSGVTSIYWYFRSKDELVDALTQRILSEVQQQLPPVGDGPWDAELFSYFDAFHDLLQNLPAYREVIAYGSGYIVHSALTRSAQRRLDAGLDLLLRAGLEPEAAAEVFGACVNYTRGFVVLQQGAQQHSDDEKNTDPAPGADGPEDATAGAPGSHMQADVVNNVSQVDDERFRLGLRLLVAGIRAEAEVRRAR